MSINLSIYVLYNFRLFDNNNGLFKGLNVKIITKNLKQPKLIHKKYRLSPNYFLKVSIE